MSATPFANEWRLRTVLETSSRPCWICYKPTTRVLTTPNDKDYFFICEGHVTDRGFASHIVDAGAEAARAKQAALDREIEQVTHDYEEKQRRKKEKAKNAKKDEDGDEEKRKEKEKKKNEDEEDDGGDDKAKKERDDKIKSLKTSEAASESDQTSLPQIYELHRYEAVDPRGQVNPPGRGHG